MDPRNRLADRFRQAGNVTPLKPKTSGPALTIHGRKYLLSDWWPAMNLGDEDGPLLDGGAKLINVGGGNRFRYLWVLDTERKVLAMWRHSDGNEKYNSRESSSMSEIFALEKRRQLNRATHEEFQQVAREMKRLEDDQLEHLKQWSKEHQSDLEKQAEQIFNDWFDRNVRPTLKRKFNEVEKGVIPFGFKVNPDLLQHRSESRQVRQWLLTKALEGFDQDAAYKLVSKQVGYDTYDPPNGDPQAVQWAYHDFIQRVYEELGD